MLDGVSAAAKAVQAFKAKSVTFAINAAKKAARTTGLPKAAAAMADVVSKIPAGRSTVGEIIANSIKRMDSLCDEILKTGKPLEDFGVYAEDQLASLDSDLVTKIGAPEHEAALRGHVELKDSLGDSYETDFIDTHRATDGTLDTDAVVSDLETFNDPSSIPDWKQKILDGNAFDKARALAYDYNQVYVKKSSGKGYYRLDSYDPAGSKIVSRKYTQFANISEDTGKKYVDELAAKYPSGATIADVPSNNKLKQLGITQLQGNLYLEVPVQTSPIPQSVLDRAASKNVTIIDVNGTTY